LTTVYAISNDSQTAVLALVRSLSSRKKIDFHDSKSVMPASGEVSAQWPFEKRPANGHLPRTPHHGKRLLNSCCALVVRSDGF
jgi:hypothetical protein